jgi:hypothetical protein
LRVPDLGVDREPTIPIVELRLFKRRNFWTGTLAMSLAYGVFFGNVVVLPLWLIQFMGYTATDAGTADRAGRNPGAAAVAVRRQARRQDRSARAWRPSHS